MVRRGGRLVRRGLVAGRTKRWRPYSRLLVVGDRYGWSIADDAEQLERIAARLGIATAPGAWATAVRDQSVFYPSQFALLGGAWPGSANRLGTAYLHGRPGTPGMPEFDDCAATLRAHRSELDRVQVTHGEMRDVVLETGIDPAKVFLIPIGIEIERFQRVSPESRGEARRRYEVPDAAFVVGSLVKDGVGWGEGLEPKLIKGPDVFLQAVELLRDRVPELFVLLTAPARGYVKRGLGRLGIPYRHVAFHSRSELPAVYRTLDVCLVASRQEGGPKAVLEAMASGIPLVTTRVGQATELVRHGENGWLADVEDAAALAEWTVQIYAGPGFEPVLERARLTAEAESYEAQTPRWRQFLDGFVAPRA